MKPIQGLSSAVACSMLSRLVACNSLEFAAQVNFVSSRGFSGRTRNLDDLAAWQSINSNKGVCLHFGGCELSLIQSILDTEHKGLLPVSCTVPYQMHVNQAPRYACATIYEVAAKCNALNRDNHVSR